MNGQVDLYLDEREEIFFKSAGEGHYKIDNENNMIYMTKEQAYKLLEQMQNKLRVDIRG